MAKALTNSVVSTFEKHMDNDLDMKAAFDASYSAVVKLQGLKKKKAYEMLKQQSVACKKWTMSCK
jgi:hypothetical protein